MAKKDQPVDRWVEDNRIEPNRVVYGLFIFVTLAIVAVVLLVWLL
jgi:hypothetical protein